MVSWRYMNNNIPTFFFPFFFHFSMSNMFIGQSKKKKFQLWWICISKKKEKEWMKFHTQMYSNKINLCKVMIEPENSRHEISRFDKFILARVSLSACVCVCLCTFQIRIICIWLLILRKILVTNRFFFFP